MKKYRKMSIIFMLFAALFLTGCSAEEIAQIINNVSQAVQEAVPAVANAINTIQQAFSNFGGNRDTVTENPNDIIRAPMPTQAERPPDNDPTVTILPTDQEEPHIQQDDKEDPSVQEDKESNPEAQEPTPEQQESAPEQQEPAPENEQSEIVISERGKTQMARIVEYARNNNTGRSGGMCFNAVWGYMTSSGYGNLNDWNDLPEMGDDEARHLSEYLNGAQSRLDEAGLQRIDNSLTPPITNPHDPRIPDGAIIVVSAGSTGTAHPTAGDVVVKAGDRFINDGPNMNYGTRETWRGNILGIYIPK